MREGNSRGKTARQSHEMWPPRKETRRIQRREVEAEHWAQARMQNLSYGPMPTNRAATNYLSLHYPWLLDQDPSHINEMLPEIASAAVGSVITTANSGSAGQSFNPVPSSHVLNSLVSGDSSKKAMSSFIPQSLSTSSPALAPESISVRSPQPTYAAILASEVPVMLAQGEPRKVSLRRSDRVIRKTQESNSPSMANSNRKSAGELTIPVNESSLVTDLEAISSASSLTSEHLRALTATIDDKIGRLLTDSSSQRDEEFLSILRKTSSWTSQRDLHPGHGALSTQAVKSNRDLVGIEAINKTHEFINTLLPRSSSQHGSIVSEKLSTPVVEAYGGPESETMLFATAQTRHTVLLPTQLKSRLPLAKPDRASISLQGSCSPSKLRPTAPVFTPQSPPKCASTNVSQRRLHSPATEVSSWTVSGSQSLGSSTRPTTASSTAFSSQQYSNTCSSSVSQIGAPIKHSVFRTQEGHPWTTSIKPTASCYLVSTGPDSPLMVNHDIANMEHSVTSNDDATHRARSAIAIELTCRATGMGPEELESFLAIPVPAIDKILAHSLVRREIRNQSMASGRHDLFRFVTQRSKTADNSEHSHGSSPTIMGSKHGLYWEAKDFKGFRVLPSDLRLAEMDGNLDDLASAARISRHVTKRRPVDNTGVRQTLQALGGRHNVRQESLIDPNKAINYATSGGKIDSSVEVFKSHKGGQDINQTPKFAKDYKEEAYFSDPDDTIRNQKPQEISAVVETGSKLQQEQDQLQKRKQLPGKKEHKVKASPRTPLQQLERQSKGLLDAYRAHITRQYQATKDKQEIQKENLMLPKILQEASIPSPLNAWLEIHSPGQMHLANQAMHWFWLQGVPTGPRYHNTHPNQQHHNLTYGSHYMHYGYPG